MIGVFEAGLYAGVQYQGLAPVFVYTSDLLVESRRSISATLSLSSRSKTLKLNDRSADAESRYS